MNKSSLQFFNRCTTRELKMEKHKGTGVGPTPVDSQLSARTAGALTWASL